MNLKYTVALCTHNHADRLIRTLSDLSRLKPPTAGWELLLVDNASSDSTAAILADPGWHPRSAEVRIVHEETLGLSHARNRAIEEAHGEYLLFMDDDETPDPEWLLAYEAAIREHAPDALGGRIEVLFEGERPGWLTDELLGFLGQLDHGAADWLTRENTPFYGGNFVVRKDLFTRVGGFDTGLGRRGLANEGGEDTEFYRRLIGAGCRVRWVPEAVIHHRIQATKLRRGYFLDLHYRQGRMEGSRAAKGRHRLPPRHLFGQLWRALQKAIGQRLRKGADSSLRLEMNVAYFIGYIHGWSQQPPED